ncbi:3,4-dihydroxy-2-butanone-4-phosphate synthase [Saccharopolyspora spinosa]|uniref:3,4-dihydroxy-2-butanone-4-phosphate synthase n=1 Tax=Saccharopolyspora spinosa TaxID=60894 RepID=A0A2N3Y025_SACSN|nr:3,4-dihydroxy-2-butanone-4-phosphate synthase [Saccharopolyspora spinosa]PKW16274.1 3,4-dihydroxy 2-butanone 4-phosphate synthase/GTP cyclohydrolase II [Saccharopolyspora spinosa]
MTAQLDPPVSHSGPAAGIGPALAALQAGRPVLVVDDAGREDEGDVVLPAALADPAWVAWTVRHTSGLLCAPMEADRADALDLPPMVWRNADPHATAYTISVDAAEGVGTGISAADRARTAQVLADPRSVASDLRRPGHVLPLRARPGGVVERPGHTEAAVDLCRLAGLPPVGVIAELVTGPDEPGIGATAKRSEVAALGAQHGLPLLDVADLVRYRLYFGDGVRGRVTRGARAALPIAHGGFDAVGFRDEVTGAEHVALVRPSSAARPLIAVHVECIAGDVFGSQACNCRRELEASLTAVARNGGAVVYLRPASTGARILSGSHDAEVACSDMHAAVAAAVLADLGLAEVRLRARGAIDVSALAAGGISAVAV